MTIENKKDEEEKVKCFVIMPISNQNGYEDNHFQFVYEDIICPAIDLAGMTPFRADETKNTNLIHLDILRNAIDAPIAICDMSAKNPNVFYELGVRQAFDMPTVLMRDDVTTIPFDINGLRYVTYNKDMKHRSVIKAKKDLAESLKNTYEKRLDKTEINSLIRLMDLANPAKLNQVELSDEARFEKLNELLLNEIVTAIDALRVGQDKINATLADNLSSQISAIDIERYKPVSVKPTVEIRRRVRPTIIKADED
jgi:hypothetical protein